VSAAAPRRPRWPRFRPAVSAALVGAYPRHTLLAALTAGMLAGPRSGAVVLAAACGCAFGAALAATRPGATLDAGAWAASEAGAESPRGTVPPPSWVGRGPAGVRVPAARVAAVLALAAVAVAGGALVAQERIRALDRTALRPQAHARIGGFVAEPPRRRSYGTIAVPVEVRGGERVLLRLPARVRTPRMRVGDGVAARGRLRALRAHEGFERRRRVHAVLEVDRIRPTGRTRGSPLDRARRHAEDAMSAGLPHEQAALARGMVLGQDDALGEELREAFRVAGLAHLVAASGTNVMLLAALVLGLGALAGLPATPRLVLALAAIAFYVPLAGAGPSIQRAGAMGAVGLVAVLAGRPASRWYALLLAAVVTLAVDPRAAEDPGWQLSFAAVVTILALHARLRGALVARHAPGPLADVAALTIAATLGTAPLLSLHFGQVSLVSLPANLLAAPAVAPVMWLGTLAGAAGEPVAPALNALAAFPLSYLAWLGRAAAALPHASLEAQLPGPPALAASYLAIALACSRPRVVVPLAIVGIAVALLLAPGPARPPAGPTLSVLDVGQGDAVLLQDGPRALLFDTGGPGAPLERELRASGVRSLDAVVLTHSSSDHEGGLVALLDAMPVGLVLDGRGQGVEHGGEGGGARYEGLPAGQARDVPAAGQVLRAGRITVEILWPPAGDERRGDPNLTAVVALARAGRTSALLTADAESPVTLPLDLPAVDVLKVAHHGSADDGLGLLLERLRPRTAVIPVGRNTYGHPAPDTMAALRVVPDVRRTDRDGTVRVPLAP
jgi:competence protein ComEC